MKQFISGMALGVALTIAGTAAASKIGRGEFWGLQARVQTLNDFIESIHGPEFEAFKSQRAADRQAAMRENCQRSFDAWSARKGEWLHSWKKPACAERHGMMQ